MKISEAQNIYRAHRQELIDQTRNLIRQREEAQHKYHATGSVEFSEQAVTLQLSVDAVREKFEENEKILDELERREQGKHREWRSSMLWHGMPRWPGSRPTREVNRRRSMQS